MAKRVSPDWKRKFVTKIIRIFFIPYALKIFEIALCQVMTNFSSDGLVSDMRAKTSTAFTRETIAAKMKGVEALNHETKC